MMMNFVGTHPMTHALGVSYRHLGVYPACARPPQRFQSTHSKPRVDMVDLCQRYPKTIVAAQDADALTYIDTTRHHLSSDAHHIRVPFMPLIGVERILAHQAAQQQKGPPADAHWVFITETVAFVGLVTGIGIGFVVLATGVVILGGAL